MSKTHEHWLEAALSLARQAPEHVTYAVGCLIIAGNGEQLAAAFTGQYPYPVDGLSRSSPHAEELALLMIPETHSLRSATLYSSMEPCSERKSGRVSCTQRIIQRAVGTVVFGAAEPFDPKLGIHCQGASELRAAGVNVIHLEGMADRCLGAALRAGN